MARMVVLLAILAAAGWLAAAFLVFVVLRLRGALPRRQKGDPLWELEAVRRMSQRVTSSQTR